MPIGIQTICWYTMQSNCTYMFSMRKVRTSHHRTQDQYLYESYFLKAKKIKPYLKNKDTFVTLCWITSLPETTLLLWQDHMAMRCIKQNRSTEGCSKLKRSVDMTSSGRMVSTLEQMQVPNGTGPGVRRSKRPLLASRTRCNVPWKPSEIW